MINAWKHIDQKVCLTLGGSEWDKACEEFNRVELFDVKRFDALPDIGPHQSFNVSTRKILENFYNSKHETLLFLEDDVEFRELGHLETALKELPKDFDICFLGANISDPGWAPPMKVGNHLCKIINAWTTHALIYRKPVIEFILKNQPGPSERMYDNWLSEHYCEFDVYIVAPMVAWQRGRHSNIWGHFVNYYEQFKTSEDKLRKAIA